MQASSSQRALELERVYQSRRGHTPQISISDESHHVTEAIGDMYGDNDFTQRDSRPLSFLPSPNGDSFENSLSYFSPTRSSPPRTPLSQTTTNERASPQVNGSPKTLAPSPRSPSLGHDKNPMSPPKLNRTTSDTASQQFPLNDIDYESSPAAVAQELSNLQAIRRMSMDVNASDPDLPSFASGFSVPSIAPSHSADDDDASRLFWVPARLHPELAPKEFKTFIEDKVEKIKRRSGDGSLSPDSLERQGSGSSLRRKKSMLSRQIDGPNGYHDGAERLERKKSLSKQADPNAAITSLHELEHLVEDPNAIRRMSEDTVRHSSDSGVEVPAAEDMPILAPKPPSTGLKRSTRTNYRRGSLRKGERVPFSKRMAARHGGAGTDSETSPTNSPLTASTPDLPSFSLQRVQTEPMPQRHEPAENFSRPTRRRSPPITASTSSEDLTLSKMTSAPDDTEARQSPPLKTFHSRIASNGRTTAPLPGYNTNVPQIIETPPPESQQRAPTISPQHLPPRGSSREPPSNYGPQPVAARGPPPASRPPPNRPPLMRQQGSANAKTPSQTLDDMASHPSPLPGNRTTTTDLSFIPTLPEDQQKSQKKSKKKDDSDGGSRKTSWNWLLGGDDKEKEKEREKREKEETKKSKNKLSKVVDKSHDNTRLDVLQTSIDGNRGRESVVLDRETIKLEEERKKESSRKSSGGDKKEKDGLFSSLFGGGKKKGDRDSTGKKRHSDRGLSPEPPPRILKPDIDYNWTRFSILEERAIYRMAHIKLANPKRDLYSQVLLSNFMYSYLAKVQAMHPQIQIGQRDSQKQQARQEAQRKKDQPEEFSQYQRYQQQQAAQDNRSDAGSSYAESSSDAQAGPPSDGDALSRQNSHASQQSAGTGGNPNGLIAQAGHRDPPQQSGAQSASGSGQNATGYSVSNSQNYLGQGGGGLSYYQQNNLFQDEKESRDDDMW